MTTRDGRFGGPNDRGLAAFARPIDCPNNCTDPQVTDRGGPARGINASSPGKTNWAPGILRLLLGDRNGTSAINDSFDQESEVIFVARRIAGDPEAEFVLSVKRFKEDRRLEPFIFAIYEKLLLVREICDRAKMQVLYDSLKEGGNLSDVGKYLNCPCLFSRLSDTDRINIRIAIQYLAKFVQKLVSERWNGHFFWMRCPGIGISGEEKKQSGEHRKDYAVPPSSLGDLSSDHLSSPPQTFPPPSTARRVVQRVDLTRVWEIVVDYVPVLKSVVDRELRRNLNRRQHDNALLFEAGLRHHQL